MVRVWVRFRVFSMLGEEDSGLRITSSNRDDYVPGFKGSRVGGRKRKRDH
jgi:hypothetical protein